MSTPSPFLLLSGTLQGLLGRVGGWHLRGCLGDALMFLLYRRISMCRVRMERLAGRYLAGTLRPRAVTSGAAAATVAGEEKVRAPVAPKKRIWPGRSGWLLWCLVPHSWEAGQYGAPLRHALESPEMQAMLRDVPQAARILGPVCRMLAIPASVYRPGFVAKVRAVRDPAVKRVRKPRPVLDWGRTKIPRGVKTWIRRELRMDRARAEVARIRKERYGI